MSPLILPTILRILRPAPASKPRCRPTLPGSF